MILVMESNGPVRDCDWGERGRWVSDMSAVEPSREAREVMIDAVTPAPGRPRRPGALDFFVATRRRFEHAVGFYWREEKKSLRIRAPSLATHEFGTHRRRDAGQQRRDHAAVDTAGPLGAQVRGPGASGAHTPFSCPSSAIGSTSGASAIDIAPSDASRNSKLSGSSFRSFVK